MLDFEKVEILKMFRFREPERRWCAGVHHLYYYSMNEVQPCSHETAYPWSTEEYGIITVDNDDGKGCCNVDDGPTSSSNSLSFVNNDGDDGADGSMDYGIFVRHRH
jgi:hypothetical protein